MLSTDVRARPCLPFVRSRFRRRAARVLRVCVFVMPDFALQAIRYALPAGVYSAHFPTVPAPRACNTGAQACLTGGASGVAYGLASLRFDAFDKAGQDGRVG
jgi:hypothetical protein